MKNVAIAAASPAPNETVANSILGKVVEPKTRWNVGSLIGSIIGEITQAVCITVTASKLRVYTPALAADGISPLALETIIGLARITPRELTGRSRSLNFQYANGTIFTGGVTEGTDLFPTNGAIPIEFEPFFIRAYPSFTLQGLISAMLPTLENEDFMTAFPNWFIAIDQFTGEVFYHESGGGLETSIETNLANDLYLEFDLVADIDSPEVQGPVWG